MALTLPRLAAGTLLACAAIAVARLPPPPDPPETRYAPPRELHPTERRVLRLRGELAAARRALAYAERRDRRFRLIAASVRPGGIPAIVTEITLPESNRRALADRLAVVWERLGAPADDIAVGIVILDFGRPTQVLPPATDGRICLMELPLDWEVRWVARVERVSDAQLEAWIRSGLGPCAYYGMFGRAGPYVEQWLLDRSFDLAWDADWSSAPVPARETAPSLSPLLRGIMFWELDDRYAASLDAVACGAGDHDRCRAALFHPTVSLEERSVRHAVPGVVTRPWRFGNTGSLYRGNQFLADVIREMGRERFAAFWRSPLPVDEAFQSAMGLPIEQWTARWEQSRMGPMTVGSRVRGLSVVLGLFAIAACVGAVAALSRRRQIA